MTVCCTTETARRPAVVIIIFQNNHAMMSVAVDDFTLEQQTTNVATVTTSWYKLVKYVVKTTVVPYMLVMVIDVVMGNHTIMAPSTVYVGRSTMITSGSVVVVKWSRKCRDVVAGLCQVVRTPRTLRRNAVEISMFLYRVYVVSPILELGR